MRYANLADDIDHTCVYQVEAESRERALQDFFDLDSPNIENEKQTESAAKADRLRFEIHEIRATLLDGRIPFFLFCSDDQAWEVEPVYLDNHLGQRHTQLGMIYLYHERWNEAVEEFLKAYKLQQNGITKYGLSFQLAEAYIGQGNTDAAIEIYKTALD